MDIFDKYNINYKFSDGLEIISPLNEKKIAKIKADDDTSLNAKAIAAKAVQDSWFKKPQEDKARMLLRFSDLLEKNASALAEIIHHEAGKTIEEAIGEAKNFVATIRKTLEIVDSNEYDNLENVTREKVFNPVGVVGLITSFNFPLAVAGWNIAPALLAGNAVLWKPSEKTPLVALAIKDIFLQAQFPSDLLQIIIGGVDVGKAFVSNENVNMISATGSVEMGKSIKTVLENKSQNLVPPILELGGNNGVIISEKNDDEAITHSVKSIAKSFFGNCGQRCTNTRRVFVHEKVFPKILDLFKQEVAKFEVEAPLIDDIAVKIYEKTLSEAQEQGGEVLFGGKIEGEGYYVKPAICVMPEQTKIMYEECFAPVLFLVKYKSFSDAIELINAPSNAGLVNGLYTQSIDEADEFAAKNLAGHSVINTSTGTGAPAHGLGFGGNKDSGTGEILNQRDPLRPFVKGANRIVIGKKIKLK